MNRETIKQKISLFSLFFTFGVDNLGATIIFPIFAPLFLDSTHNLLGAELSLVYKTTLLGVFLGIFPFMQFFFSPILGEYADHYGRKRALLLTTFFTFTGYGFSAWGIHALSLFWIFFGRMLMGIGAGNLSICLSSLADISPGPRKKVRYFSYGSAIAGATFILGPFVGGKLSDPFVNPFFNDAFPMLVGTVLGLVNVFFILFAFSETLKRKSRERFDFIRGIHNLRQALKTGAIKNLYLLYFFYLFSWNILFLFIPAYIVQNFGLTSSRIGDICTLMGVCWIFGTAIVYRILFKRFSKKRILLFAFLLFAILILFVPFPENLKWFLVFLGGCTLISGLIWPLCTGAISNAAPPEIQGKVMGLSQSMLSLTMVFSSIIGGLFLHAHSLIPFIFSSFSSLLALFILTRTRLQSR
jgi:DHA1 family tetracycline resistance protein-like MFS transporter